MQISFMLLLPIIIESLPSFSYFSVDFNRCTPLDWNHSSGFGRTEIQFEVVNDGFNMIWILRLFIADFN
ncbi:hypothetical protein L1987_05177 [Smallanthus sonchifolius]|uniref:Uncharacterized protein n=1 Tax=Smallanthus sonchifolius TaxID=185202 RepID=A0ACB9JUM8_9ASTR|nr:hypothetical protein L1987_05177 [Smallanthus sonchifolius]